MSDSFRLLDVDQFDEDALRPEDVAAVDHKTPDVALSQAQQKQGTVRSRVSAGDTAGALAALLEDVPFGAANDAARNVTIGLLLEILNATRVADIPGAVRGLDLLQRDTLMKYLYKGMALGGTSSGASHGINCAVLLSWHEKVCGLLTAHAGGGHRLYCTCHERSERAIASNIYHYRTTPAQIAVAQIDDVLERAHHVLARRELVCCLRRAVCPRGCGGAGARHVGHIELVDVAQQRLVLADGEHKVEDVPWPGCR